MKVDRRNILDELTSIEIENQIHQISNECLVYFDEVDSSLYSGKAGLILLYSVLAKIYPEKYSEVIKKLLPQSIYSLENNILSLTLSSGIAGTAYALSFAQNLCDLHILDEENFLKIDKYITNSIETEFIKNNWDPLHGYIGLGIYFLERNKYTNHTTVLSKIVDNLYEKRNEYIDWQLWITPGYKNISTDNINFGLAHGISGVVVFLALVAREKIATKKCKELIDHALKFFFANTDKAEGYSSYPSSINLKDGKINNNSRIAWCYGDLCVANAFLAAGNTFDNEDWVNHAIEIILKTVDRKFEDTGIIDPCFCHGIAGIIHQYSRYYELTQNDTIKEYIQRMIELNNRMFYNPQTGIGGYQYTIFDEKMHQRQNIDSPGLLEGSAGIALVYLNILNNIPDWDLAFLTKF